MALIAGSDWVDWQGNGFMDLAGLRRLGSRIADAFEALAQAAVRFAAKGNIVSAHWADELADDLPATLSRTVQDPLQAAVPGCAG